MLLSIGTGETAGTRLAALRATTGQWHIRVLSATTRQGFGSTTADCHLSDEAPFVATLEPRVLPSSHLLCAPPHLRPTPLQLTAEAYAALIAINGHLIVLTLEWRLPFWNLHATYARALVAEGALLPMIQILLTGASVGLQSSQMSLPPGNCLLPVGSLLHCSRCPAGYGRALLPASASTRKNQAALRRSYRSWMMLTPPLSPVNERQSSPCAGPFFLASRSECTEFSSQAQNRLLTRPHNRQQLICLPHSPLPSWPHAPEPCCSFMALWLALSALAQRSVPLSLAPSWRFGWPLPVSGRP